MRNLPAVTLLLAASLALPSACESAAQQPGATPAAKAAAPMTDLDQLLAPIALYPDQLLSQILLCTRDPAQLVRLNAFIAKNQTVKGTALQDSATAAGFDPSFVALVLFPQVVEMLARDIDRTTALGKTFGSDQKAVFASIQRLRARAQEAGALKDTPQQQVEAKTTPSGEQVIIIEPANPQVVYVPQYNSTTVYVEDDNSADAAAAGLIGFTAGIAIGAAIDNDYYYGPYGMHGAFYMYNDAWDDWYDHREDAREDWQDHREDVMEERGDRNENRQEQRTERAGSRDGSARAERAADPSARGYSPEGTSRSQPARDLSGTRSDAFSGYSSGRSERAASTRGQRSRSSSGGARRSGGRR